MNYVAHRLLLALSLCAFALTAAPAMAQGSNLAFGQNAQNSDEPVEVEADSLAISQNDGTAEFTGNVKMTQGDLRMTAPRVLVRYAEDQSRIQSLEATGGVVIVSGEDVAESERADYDVDAAEIVLSGSVTVVQGQTTLTSERMTISLDNGTAVMQGRVRTLLQPGSN
ncbi:organic solvent tolerance protein OstA [Oceanicola sp. 22II-s10i]|uniref:lipopolysaccharide transport periplasmic protein LptA n=1 Tax=Oceanicola sp. 22II-s10i TaxID=1317116 RepID=UPI000B520A07|nr:lipopolysaccharide transport periplasmic protein LptA [Oceanicola sp. 22II-s10i]OWU86283.1 organic solvent tolerance protein OstA [Oceanicola sp. 22II-s10i]